MISKAAGIGGAIAVLLVGLTGLLVFWLWAAGVGVFSRANNAVVTVAPSVLEEEGFAETAGVIVKPPESQEALTVLQPVTLSHAVFSKRNTLQGAAGFGLTAQPLGNVGWIFGSAHDLQCWDPELNRRLWRYEGPEESNVFVDALYVVDNFVLVLSDANGHRSALRMYEFRAPQDLELKDTFRLPNIQNIQFFNVTELGHRLAFTCRSAGLYVLAWREGKFVDQHVAFSDVIVVDAVREDFILDSDGRVHAGHQVWSVSGFTLAVGPQNSTLVGDFYRETLQWLDVNGTVLDSVSIPGGRMGATPSSFGQSLCTYGDSVLVGAPDDHRQGNVFVFQPHPEGFLLAKQVLTDASSTLGSFGHLVVAGPHGVLIGDTETHRVHLYAMQVQ